MPEAEYAICEVGDILPVETRVRRRTGTRRGQDRVAAYVRKRQRRGPSKAVVGVLLVRDWGSERQGSTTPTDGAADRGFDQTRGGGSGGTLESSAGAGSSIESASALGL